MHATYTPEELFFILFALRWAVFELRPNFRKGVHRMTPNDLDTFKVKNTNRHVKYKPEVQIFICFPPRWAVFELWPNFRKSGPNDPKWPWHVQGQKYKHACYIHPRGPNFRPFHSTGKKPFLSYGPFFGKVHQINPKWPWYVQGQN